MRSILGLQRSFWENLEVKVQIVFETSMLQHDIIAIHANFKLYEFLIDFWCTAATLLLINVLSLSHQLFAYLPQVHSLSYSSLYSLYSLYTTTTSFVTLSTYDLTTNPTSPPPTTLPPIINQPSPTNWIPRTFMRHCGMRVKLTSTLSTTRQLTPSLPPTTSS